MFDPIKELTLAVATLIATVIWWMSDATPESRSAVGLTLFGTVIAGFHLAYRLGAESILRRQLTGRLDQQAASSNIGLEQPSKASANIIDVKGDNDSTPQLLHHVSLPVRDLERSTAFYKLLLQSDPISSI